jgi:hypothetical protein
MNFNYEDGGRQFIRNIYLSTRINCATSQKIKNLNSHSREDLKFQLIINMFSDRRELFWLYNVQTRVDFARVVQ